MVVPYPAGGPADAIARILGDRMRTPLGQPVIVENVSGAGGSIGVARVARAAPDGYTLSIGQLNSHVFSGAAYSVRYDLLKDLDPVALADDKPADDRGEEGSASKESERADRVAQGKSGQGILCVHPVLAVRRMFGGSISRTTLALTSSSCPIAVAAPALQAVLSGQIDLTCLQASDLLPQVRSGNVKAYAILAKDHWARATDIPTVDEAGVPGLYMPFWHGLWAPANTPRDVIAQAQCRRCRSVERSAGTPTICRYGTGDFSDVSSRRLTPSPLCRRPKSKSGGQSSRLRTSRASDPVHTRMEDCPNLALRGEPDAQTIG